MSVYFTGLAILATFASVSILLWCLKEGEIKEIKKYTLIGSFSVTIDFIVEYLGTSTGGWVYHSSLFAIFGLVPVELIVIFFGAGICVRFAYLHLKKLSFSTSVGFDNLHPKKLPFSSTSVRFDNLHPKTLPFSLNINIDKILYPLLVLTFSYYVIWTFQRRATLLPFATVFGLWGILRTSKESRGLALSIAALASVTNFVAEIVIISSGAYAYNQGFNISIPVIYAFFTLGIIGLIEDLEDRF